MSTEQLALDPNKECTFYLQKAFFSIHCSKLVTKECSGCSSEDNRITNT